MAAVNFASKIRADGSLGMPREVVDELGLQPGDEVQVRVESTNGLNHNDAEDQATLQDKFERFFEKLDTLTFEKPPSLHRSDPADASFSDAMEEKYRKLGFK